MIKVLRILNRFNIGGPSYNAALLTRYMGAEYETKLIGGKWERGEESSMYLFEELGLKPEIIPNMHRNINPMYDLKAYLHIKKIILEFKPDIVHTHAAKSGSLGRLAAKACKVPVIVHTFHGHVFHSYFGKCKTAFYKSAERILAKKTNAIITLSELQKTDIVDKYAIAPKEKVFVVPLGFDLDKFTVNQDEKRIQFRNQYQVNDDQICIIIIGRLAPVKNHFFFIRVISKLIKKFGNKIRAFIVGDGTLRNDLMQFAHKNNLNVCFWPQEEKIAALTFTSWIKDVSPVLAGSDIICMTSFNEGTPVSLIEAQAAGKALLACKAGGIEDSVFDSARKLVEQGDEEEYLRKLTELVENKQSRVESAAAGKNFVFQKFHYQRLVHDTQSLYQKILQSQAL